MTNEQTQYSIEQGIELCLAKNIVFAAYRLPASADVHLIIHKEEQPLVYTDTSKIFSKEGFVVHPFNQHDMSVNFIRADYQFRNKIEKSAFGLLKKLKINSYESATEKPIPADQKAFIQLIDKVKDTCSNGEPLKKIVMSRVITREGDFLNQVPEIFRKLCDKYAHAFVFVFNIGNQIWIGASPEPFLISKDGTIHTTSVAGTRAYTEENMNASWNKKEIEEQAIVTDYITQVLEKFQVSKYKLEGPYTKKAGNVIHLRTDIQFYNQLDTTKLGDFISELHPTPAVCGYNKQNAFDFILTHEKHNREYYSGFLGPVKSLKDFSLFVNLRSMKVLADMLVLYVGGGITSGSVSMDEWNEMEMKAETLLSVLTK